MLRARRRKRCRGVASLVGTGRSLVRVHNRDVGDTLGRRVA